MNKYLMDIIKNGNLRGWINLFEQQIQSELYHGTNLEGVVGILWSDSLNDDAWDDEYSGASFTTDYAVAQSFAEGTSRARASHIAWGWSRSNGLDRPDKAETLDELEAIIDPKRGTGGAVLVFDRALLATKHNLQDYNYSELNQEFEVRSLTGQQGKSTPPVTYALKRIDIFDPVSAKKFLKSIPIMLTYYDEYKSELDRVISLVKTKGAI